MKIKNVCIVGGGSAGWMTAAALVKAVPWLNLTLIESKEIGNIGVGESTIGHINSYMAALGLKDEDWMSKCNATYKTSIKFTDFNPGKTFHYPFGKFDFTDSPNGLMDWFNMKLQDPDTDDSNFAEYFHSSVAMIDANKMTNNENGELRGFDFKSNTAYHMDASLFGEFLRDEFCLPSGMTHIFDNVTDVNLNSDGSVKSLSTKNSGELTADLFIDCTGFNALLLDKALKVPFINFNDVLINDRAVAAQIPYIDKDKEMESVTNCTAIEAGWCWNIPLYTRIGAGYVYSSKFATQEEAEQQFRNYLAKTDPERAENAECFHIKIRHGIHETPWKHNVVGVGLSSGFIEPLESTGLMLAHENVLFLIRTLLRRNGLVNKVDVDGFNFSVRDTMESFRGFIGQHYALSPRRDTPYWRHVTENITYSEPMGTFGAPDNMRDNSYIDFAYRVNQSNFFDNEMGGLPYIAAGMGYNPMTKLDAIIRDNKYNNENDTWKETKSRWEEHKANLDEVVSKMPTQYQYLKEMYGDTDVSTGKVKNGVK